MNRNDRGIDAFLSVMGVDCYFDVDMFILWLFLVLDIVFISYLLDYMTNVNANQ